MKTLMKWVGGVLLGLVVIGMIGQAMMTTEDRNRMDAGWQARASVEAALRDPGSAVYGYQNVYQGGNVVCGAVNAKNGFGGYTGMKRYIWNKSLGFAFEPVGYSETFNDNYTRSCTDVPSLGRPSSLTPIKKPGDEFDPVIPPAPYQPGKGSPKPWEKTGKTLAKPSKESKVSQW